MRALLHRMMATTLVGLAALAVGSGASEAQLANSRWPMLGHDLHHTGRSDLLGPKFNQDAPGPSDVRSTTFYDKIKMFPAVGAGGVVYVGMGWQFCAINPLDVTDQANPVFTQKWCKPTIGDVSASGAAVDKDDYVYFGDRDNSVYKVRGSDGERMWESYTYQNGPTSVSLLPKKAYSNCHEGDANVSPAIGLDDTIYFAFTQNCDGNGSIMAVKNTGATTFNIKWKLGVGQFSTFSSPVVTTDPNDGKPVIILGFADSSVRAIKDNGAGGAVLWKTTIGSGSIVASPVLGADGTVYVGGYAGIYALDAVTGRLKWTFPTSPAKVDSTAALSINGIVYFVSRNGSQRTVYAIDPAPLNAKAALVPSQNPSPQDFQNAVQWTYGPVIASLSTEGGFPIIGADGIVYVGMANGVYAIQQNSGTLLWKYLTQNGVISAPVLGPPVGDAEATANQSGTAVLYIGSVDHKVYAIKSTRTGLALNLPPDVPQLAITPSQSVPAGTEVTFDASTSTDPNDDPLFFTWDLGDGTLASGPLVRHTYWTAGSYPVTLTTNDGLESITLLPKPNVNVTGGGLVYFCDGFDRADSSTLGGPGPGSHLGCPANPSSLVWEEELLAPSIATAMSISANTLRNDPVKTTHMATVSAFAGADQAVAVGFTSTYNGTGPRFGILLRFTDAQNYYVAYRWVGGASVLRISKVVNGVETVLSQVPVPNPAVNVPFTLRASVATTAGGSGAALSLQLVGGPTATATVSSSPFSGGGVGVQLMWSTSAAPSYVVDSFKACVGGPGDNCSAVLP